jgi:beta-glucanase (GH16 family)
MTVGASSWFRLCMLLAPLALGCGGRQTTETGGGETNWLRACTTAADCHASDCVCGSCTRACSDSASCSEGPPGTTCAVAGSSALAAMCGASPLPAGACLPPCSGGCASGSVCVADHCVPVREPAPPDAGRADAADGSSPNGCPEHVLGHCSGADYPSYPGFALALVEDFDEPIDLVGDPNWTYSDGHPDDNYTRFTKEAITFAGGTMIITATTPAGGVPASSSYAEGEDKNNNFPIPLGNTTVASGELRSKYNNWRYGRFEARMAAPRINRTGNFVVAFFTFRTPKWQDWRELDVEITPANDITSAGTNMVWAQTAYAYSASLNTYVPETVPSIPDGGTIFDDFHTYALEVLPTRVTWYVDGAVVRTETGRGVTLPDKSMKVMVNHWVCNSSSWGGGNPLINVYPMQSAVDWIRLYKSDADTTYPCSPTPTCLPMEDRDYAKNNAEDGLPSAAPW